MGATLAQKRYWKSPKGKAMKSRADAGYYERNGEAVREKRRERWDGMTTEERLDEGRIRRAAQDPDVRRERKRNDQTKIKREVIEGYGGRCACCDNDYMPHLTLDHIHENGAEHRRQENARSLYRRLRREGFPQGDYQVLCFNCNWAKYHLGACGCQGADLKAVAG